MQITDSKLEAKLESLPHKPGVYIFKDSIGRVIYVGKARSLRHRVKAYFLDAITADAKTRALISRIKDLEVLVTDSEMEALILEANLIKEHKPRYNVNLKDDKRYPYLKVTVDEPYPRVLIVRRVKKDKAKYFGPYTNVSGMRQTLRLIRRIFPIRSCNLTIPSPTGRKYKVCLEYYIKRCLGPCENKGSYEEYRKLIENTCLFLAGKNNYLIDELKRQMNRYAEEENFEAAARIRDQLKAMESVVQKQKVVDTEKVDQDIISLAREKNDICVVVLQIREGILIGRQDFYLISKIDTPESEILSSFVKQYYLHSPVIPEEIFLPAEIEDHSIIVLWLEEKRQGKVQLIYPQRGKKAQLLEMAIKNAQLLLNELLIQKSQKEAQIPRAIQMLQKDLYLSKPPRTMVAFDISNLGPTDAVGSLAYFEDGRPKKSEYRKFKIRNIKGQNDFAMMREIVARYFSHLIEEKKSVPDLVLIDGGKGQLSAALKALDALGVKNQEIIGLAKRLDEVYLKGKSDSLMIPKTSLSLRLLQRIRDEAHRFAVNYHRTLRGKKITKSELDEIEGIGETRKKILLSQFGSIERLKKASLTEIKKIKGISDKVAEKIYQHFNLKEQT